VSVSEYDVDDESAITVRLGDLYGLLDVMMRERQQQQDDLNDLDGLLNVMMM